jgi:imidazolonepropionase-like amidohydrolase
MLITCDELFDGRRLRGPSAIAVERDRILSVRPLGAADPVESGPNGQLHAPFVMPGLIDAHAHLLGFSEGPPGQAPFRLVENFLRLLACNGVTAVRDAGNALETTRYAERWGAEHGGPRVFPTGPLLDAPPLQWAFSRIVEDAAGAEREVARLHAEGLGWVSLYHHLPAEALRAAVAAARERGMDAAAVVLDVPAEDAIAAGVRSIEHAHSLLDLRDERGERPAILAHKVRLWSRVDLRSDDVRRLTDGLLEAGTFVCPLLLVAERWCSIEAMVEEPHLEYLVAVMPYARNLLRMRQPVGMMVGKRHVRQHLPIPALSKQEQGEVERGLATLGALAALLHEAGVPVVAGSDAPAPSVVPGFSLHQEMRRMARGGMPPTAVLASATAEAAALLRQEGTLGAVAPGALADLLLIDGNPSVDLEDTQKVATVIKGGSPVPRAEMFSVLSTSLEPN